MPTLTKKESPTAKQIEEAKVAVKQGYLSQDEYNKMYGSATPTPAPAPVDTGVDKTNSYTIVKGDTLGGIAKAHNTTVDELMKLNPNIKNPNLIYTGGSLTLPE